ncbi:hypothetical protein BJY16_006351 [Actinoplanes octamycinicus]|uniref:Uncharacterized protein n=1 Tax=Actinoplanes octamycinicus TaxID=135948 RepID=A0A7W7MAE1_9ACTN|nr:hypothetical protein [Actinoplanes octamycinicus]
MAFETVQQPADASAVIVGNLRFWPPILGHRMIKHHELVTY